MKKIFQSVGNCFFGKRRMEEKKESIFQQCLFVVLEHEGGYSDHPRDPGGATKYGITRDVYSEWLGRRASKDEIRDLTINDIAPIYREFYWKKSGADQMPLGINLSVFDFSVNAGVYRAIQTLQTLLPGAATDGIFGPQTLQLTKEFNNDTLLVLYSEERKEFYQSLSTFDVFGKGWLNRTEKTLKFSKELYFNGEIS